MQIFNPPWGINSNKHYDIREYIPDDLHKEPVNGLNNEWVFFVREAEKVLEQLDYGIVAFIVDDGIIDNSLCRKLRKHLMTTANDIRVINLHGNNIKERHNIKAKNDRSVFNIKQGAAIVFLIKNPYEHNGTTVKYIDLYGSREYKKQFLTSQTLEDIAWNDVTPHEPLYNFKIEEQRNSDNLIWDSWDSIEDICVDMGCGSLSSNNNSAYAYTEDEFQEKAKDIMTISKVEGAEKYELRKKVKKWLIIPAQQSLCSGYKITKIMLRPYDFRITAYPNKIGFIVDPNEISKHVTYKDNIVLGITSEIAEDNFTHVLISNYMIDFNCMKSYSSKVKLIPCYRYTKNGIEGNINPKFTNKIELMCNANIGLDFSEADVFSYICAILYSPMYRKKYAPLLKNNNSEIRNYPRIPVLSEDKFFALVKLGEELIDICLLKDTKLNKSVKFNGNGDYVVSDITYDKNKLYINSGQYFSGVTQDVYDTCIGRCRVISDWLTARKNRKLSEDEIRYITKVIKALIRIPEIQRQIDEVIGAFV